MGAKSRSVVHRRTTIGWWLAITLAFPGCGGPGLARFPWKGDPTRASVLQGFVPGNADVVFARAIHALEARHFELETCDADRGAIRTAVVEHDAACGTSTCLARETVTVKVGWRAVRVEVARVVFDGATRGWTEGGDDAVVRAALRDAQALAETVTDPASHYGRVFTSGDPCASHGRTEPGALANVH